MHVIISGAGITGLVAALGFRRHGHRVSVYERKPDHVFQNEGGVGLELQSNAMKILDAWNIDISSVAHNNRCTQFRRYDTAELVAEHVPASLGTKWWALRSDFRRLLFSHASSAGAEFYFDKNFRDVDFALHAVTFSDGEIVSADFVIGADGVHSRMRQLMFPQSQALATVQCSFDVQIPFSDLDENQRRLFVDNEKAQLIMGPGKFVIVSVVPSREVLEVNFVDTKYGFEQDDNKHSWVELVDNTEYLRKRFEDFWPTIRSLIPLVDKFWKWRFGEVECESWISSNRRVVLAGDAVHAMVPHSAQGGSMCTEDAAALTELYRDGMPSDEQQAKRLAQAYQDLRKFRTTKVQQRARLFGQIFDVEEPAQQKKRDRALKEGQNKKTVTKGDSHAAPASIAFTVWLEEYDAFAEARRALHELDRKQARL